MDVLMVDTLAEALQEPKKDLLRRALRMLGQEPCPTTGAGRRHHPATQGWWAVLHPPRRRRRPYQPGVWVSGLRQRRRKIP